MTPDTTELRPSTTPEDLVTEPNPPSGSPLRVGGFVLLGVAAVAAVVGLVSLAGGGDAAKPTTPVPSAAAAPSSSTAPPAQPGPPLAAASTQPGVPPPGKPGPPPNALSLPPPAGHPAPAAPPPPSAAPPAAAAPASPAPNAAPPPPAPNAAPPPPAAPPAAATPSPAAPVPNAAPAPAATPAPHTEPALPGAGLPPASSSESRSSGGVKKAVTKAPVRVYNNSLVKDLAQRAASDFRTSGWHVEEVGNYAQGNIPTSTVYYRPGTSEEAAAESLASNFGMRALPRFAGLKDATPGLIVIVTKDYQRR
ncbi:LytR C-terminal domain-containing protein [Pseudonocardia spinosispora]|uniref:LytR C-terminal domain-containing protein n=1 Tax=Pseudonocardia spinosispora TaxID=103441 RepID=UPI00042567E2|nr:LytR C-terminal domain-containing protein [Pseudonocardia spinosispora]